LSSIISSALKICNVLSALTSKTNGRTSVLLTSSVALYDPGFRILFLISVLQEKI
jgi:hypothetical protein